MQALAERHGALMPALWFPFLSFLSDLCTSVVIPRIDLTGNPFLAVYAVDKQVHVADVTRMSSLFLYIAFSLIWSD